MRILALDTASDACNVALLDGDEFISDEAVIGSMHAEYLIQQLESLRSSQDFDWKSLDKIVVTIGPGSFMGIRAGISAARGLSLALSVPLVGLSNLEALAADAAEIENGTVLVVLDARRSEFYVQTFEACDGDVVSLNAPGLCSAEEAAELARESQAKIIGSGAPYIAQLIPSVKVLGVSPTPSIRGVAIRGLKIKVVSAPPSPLYIRESVC